MTDESEKRFHSIMDKLFVAPPYPASSSSRGKKRQNHSSKLALVEPSSIGSLVTETPLCRPWDRGDLMTRVSTFKSMTWFAKPEPVSALNCARRGWTNVDIDTISCEACGARFLFPTPSAWNQHQVEKAAAVFSLKLDKGHKLLCPWIDNICDDMLSQFPPTPPPILVDKFKERCDALLRLSALPVVSSSAIEFMRGPQFERFFEESLTMECKNGSTDISRTEYLSDERDVDSEKYYQAQKLISLCGWEPRVLPYVVEIGLSQNISIDVQSAKIHELTEVNVNSDDSKRPQTDPNSVVLDCKLCGASVGLWAFTKAPCPTELVRLVGYTEMNHNGTQNTGSDDATPSKESRLSLNFSIAGGPPPAKQNFKATISFPIIGRNLRARLCGDSEFGDCLLPEQEKIHQGMSGDDYRKENDNVTSLEDNALLLENEGTDGLDNSTLGNKIGTDVNDSSLVVSVRDCDLLQISDTNTVHCEESSFLPFSLEGDVDIDMSDLFGQTPSDENATDQEDSRGNLQIAANYEPVSCEKDPKLVLLEQATEFDPIRQHRHFCPWIASAFKATPGWKQTLLALLRQKGFSPSSEKSPSTSIIKMDDPITSVRNLFVSPSPKRMKRDILTNPSPLN